MERPIEEPFRTFLSLLVIHLGLLAFISAARNFLQPRHAAVIMKLKVEVTFLM